MAPQDGPTTEVETLRTEFGTEFSVGDVSLAVDDEDGSADLFIGTHSARVGSRELKALRRLLNNPKVFERFEDDDQEGSNAGA